MATTDGPPSGMYWPLVAASVGVGSITVPIGFIVLVGFAFSNYCDSGHCGSHSATWAITLGEGVITAVWIGLVLLITHNRESSVPRRARAVGVLTTAAVFSVMIWLPLVEIDHSGPVLVLLAIAAPFVAPLAGAAVAGDRRWIDGDSLAAASARDDAAPIHRQVVRGTYAASFIAAAIAVPVGIFVNIILVARGSACTDNGPCDQTSAAGIVAGEAVITVIWIGAALIAFGAMNTYSRIGDQDRAAAIVFTAIVFSLLFWGTVILALHGHHRLLFATPIAFAVAPYVGAIVAREQM